MFVILPSALISTLHRGSGSKSNQPWRMSAGWDVAAPWWHQAPNMKTFDHHWHEFYKVLYTLRLSRWCNLMTWKGKRTKSRGFRLLSDCNFDQARRAAWQVVNYRCFRQSEFYLIFLIKAWAQPFKLMQHVFMILKLNQLLNVTSVDWIISQQKKSHISIFVHKFKGVLASIIPWGCIIAIDVPKLICQCATECKQWYIK